MRLIQLTPPLSPRSITMQGQTTIPVGTTDRGWICTLVERGPYDVIALVNDGLSIHTAQPATSREAALIALTTLINWLENIVEVARYSARAGSN